MLIAFAIVTDSGAGNYLLTLQRPAATRSVYWHALRVQGITVFSGLLSALAVVGIISGGELASANLAVIIALSLSQMLDSLNKAAKAPWLLYQRDSQYGLADVVAVVLKTPIIIATFGTGSLLPLLALPLASMAQFAWLLN